VPLGFLPLLGASACSDQRCQSIIPSTLVFTHLFVVRCWGLGRSPNWSPTNLDNSSILPANSRLSTRQLPATSILSRQIGSYCYGALKVPPARSLSNAFQTFCVELPIKQFIELLNTVFLILRESSSHQERHFILAPISTRQCPICRKIKPLTAEHFQLIRFFVKGFSFYCNACDTESKTRKMRPEGV